MVAIEAQDAVAVRKPLVNEPSVQNSSRKFFIFAVFASAAIFMINDKFFKIADPTADASWGFATIMVNASLTNAFVPRVSMNFRLVSHLNAVSINNNFFPVGFHCRPSISAQRAVAVMAKHAKTVGEVLFNKPPVKAVSFSLKFGSVFVASPVYVINAKCVV